jgi:hypothetical protein
MVSRGQCGDIRQVAGVDPSSAQVVAPSRLLTRVVPAGTHLERTRVADNDALDARGVVGGGVGTALRAGAARKSDPRRRRGQPAETPLRKPMWHNTQTWRSMRKSARHAQAWW